MRDVKVSNGGGIIMKKVFSFMVFFLIIFACCDEVYAKKRICSVDVQASSFTKSLIDIGKIKVIYDDSNNNIEFDISGIQNATSTSPDIFKVKVGDSENVYNLNGGGSFSGYKDSLVSRARSSLDEDDDVFCNKVVGGTLFCGNPTYTKLDDAQEIGYDMCNGLETPSAVEACKAGMIATTYGHRYEWTTSLSGCSNASVVVGDPEEFKYQLIIKKNDVNVDCASLVGEELGDMLHTVVNVIKIVVALLLIVLGVMDFVGAIIAQDEGGIKKAQSKFVKRLLYAVAFFVAPTVIRLLLTVSHEIWPNISTDLCGIL